ncbi:hypothetical protein IQ06DRAFT_354382 [Phaeosphaeriaceae sp. SRC1lsM3a]|nr:hypothetical protein IQ06DRAFT_354382 [Stagonospora sp. SRC1lsM3a]
MATLRPSSTANVIIPQRAMDEHGDKTTFFDQNGKTLPFQVYGPYKIIHRATTFQSARDDLVSFAVNIQVFPFHTRLRRVVFYTCQLNGNHRDLDEMVQVLHLDVKYSDDEGQLWSIVFTDHIGEQWKKQFMVWPHPEFDSSLLVGRSTDMNGRFKDETFDDV